MFNHFGVWIVGVPFCLDVTLLTNVTCVAIALTKSEEIFFFGIFINVNSSTLICFMY